MTNEERLEASLRKIERRKQKEKDRKKAEREKRRRRGYRRYIGRKHKEMEKREKEKRAEKERQKKEREEEKLEHRKRAGRPKKRGPKKRRKSRARAANPAVRRKRMDYKAVFCMNGRQNGYIGAFRSAEEANSAVDRAVSAGGEVFLPRRILSDGREALDEVLILKRRRNGDDEVPVLRDQFGRLVEQRTNKADWMILDKRRISVEETFWVYGYDQRRDRKTFPWIYSNIVSEKSAEPDALVRVSVYLNKVVFKYDDGGLDIVFCKNMGEAVRFYNKLYEVCGGSGMKVMFTGSCSDLGPKRTAMEEAIMEKTGWSKRQIQRRKTKK